MNNYEKSDIHKELLSKTISKKQKDDDNDTEPQLNQNIINEITKRIIFFID